MKRKSVACPTCGKDVVWGVDNPWRPFCSERCRLLDLGEWASGNYKVPAEGPDDFEDPEPRG
ncbi:MAG TPA: DNA gyrase inhibitor YacG [Thiobacillaceae bacterium]|nr:DNA gyrase inhibitor YacG [Thiobacillaceae bacterium]HNU63279.1 DNA gyrase inhibitor YacG [Thiobacillaceae bacterium]